MSEGESGSRSRIERLDEIAEGAARAWDDDRALCGRRRALAMDTRAASTLDPVMADVGERCCFGTQATEHASGDQFAIGGGPAHGMIVLREVSGGLVRGQSGSAVNIEMFAENGFAEPTRAAVDTEVSGV